MMMTFFYFFSRLKYETINITIKIPIIHQTQLGIKVGAAELAGTGAVVCGHFEHPVVSVDESEVAYPTFII